MSFATYISSLKNEIQDYKKSGGDIYAPKRQLPYYEKIHSAVKAAKKEFGEELSVKDIYLQCGIKFDREFNRYQKLLSGLKHCVNADGFVSFPRDNAMRVEVDNLLKDMAEKINLTPSEYLILMTPYRTKDIMTYGNYVEHVREGLLKAYPDGKVSNIKREHSDLYEQIRHFQKYTPYPISFDEALEFFGFSNGNTRENYIIKQEKLKDPSEILEKLNKLYPSREVGHFISDDKSLYYQVVNQARLNDQTVAQWLDCQGYSYPFAQETLRLSKYKVDAEEHEEKLLSLKEDFLKDYSTESKDEFDMFQINNEIAKKISLKIHGEDKEETAENLHTKNLTPQQQTTEEPLEEN